MSEVTFGENRWLSQDLNQVYLTPNSMLFLLGQWFLEYIL